MQKDSKFKGDIMLLKLLPEQIPTYWDEIKDGILKTIPVGVPDRANKILNKLLLGSAQCWISYHRGGTETRDDVIIDAVIITVIVEDQVHDTLNLDIYALWSVGVTRRSSWIEGIDALKKYARKKECTRIIGRSDVESVLEFVRLAGGEARYTLIAFDV